MRSAQMHNVQEQMPVPSNTTENICSSSFGLNTNPAAAIQRHVISSTLQATSDDISNILV